MRYWIFAIGFWALAATAGWAAESYIIVDNQTGQILAAKDSNEKRQIASLTKIATAMVVLDAEEQRLINLGNEVEVPQQAVDTGGINQTGLQAGDVISIRDLLYSALLASDNVAAATLAYHVGRRLPNPTGLDSTGNFVAYLNALARTLGMKRTLFLNPHGIDNVEGELPFSCAADLARL
ncbi:MAG TPA: serine hydrolase, partial [Chthoniobacterales bacterium]